MNIGVFGTGWWGKNIINTCEELSSVEKVYGYDTNPLHYDKFASNTKFCAADHPDQIWYDPSVTAVCIATPPASHYELSLKALQSGKHVLVEKPPALHPIEVEELGRLARSNHLVYMLDAIYLFLTPIDFLKKMIDSIPPESIRYVQIHRCGDELRREGAGLQRIRQTMFQNHTSVIDDLFFHDAGILLYLFEQVSLMDTEKLFLYDPECCDTVRIRLKKNQIKIEILLSWSLSLRRRGISIYTQDQIVEYDGLKNDNQIRIHNLDTNQTEYHSFPAIPPLKTLLEFYLDCIEGKKSNHLDDRFMVSIMKLWEIIK